MARICPETESYVLYLDCLECDTRSCERTSKSTEDIRRELYWEYLQELEVIRGEKWEETEAERRTWADDYLTQSHHRWIDIRYMDQVVGFVIFSTAPECHPVCDYFLSQSYIKPEYRNKGLMTAVVTRFVKEHTGRYCMILLKKNVYAKKYWHNLFTDLGYVPFNLYDTGTLKSDEEQAGYELRIENG